LPLKAGNTADSVGNKPEMALSFYTLNMNGCIWSPQACELATRMIEEKGHVEIVGLPGQKHGHHFTLTQTLQDWSDDELNKAFVEGAD
jgi:hypothetical protein